MISHVCKGSIYGPLVCVGGEESDSVLMGFLNCHIGDVTVISKFREKQTVCDWNGKIQTCSQMEHLSVPVDHYQTQLWSAVIAALSAPDL